MIPAARIAATIEVLETVAASGRAADEVASAYFRARRYIGAKDRREIAARVFAAERHRARLDWWTGDGGARAGVLAALVLADGQTPGEIAALFDGGKFAPAPLSAEEIALVERLAGNGIEHPDMPARVRLELPEWLFDKLSAAWGARLETEMAALNQAAPLDLRVNTLKADREGARAQLGEDGIAAEPTPRSPLGLRVTGRINLAGTRAFRRGLVEVQDEGSQLAALLAGAKADKLAVDLCAGAGGKTLALAAAMKDGGPLIACDTDAARMKRMEARLLRAGVSNVTRRQIAGPDDAALAALAGRAERVMVDAPCSGSGAWRRNPGARWRLTPERLAQHVGEQRRILAAAARLCAPGGRVIYVTCSVFPEENEEQADLFIEAEPEFRALPIVQVWAETIGTPCPVSDAETYLTLTPARSGTDGFFVAVFARDHDT